MRPPPPKPKPRPPPLPISMLLLLPPFRQSIGFSAVGARGRAARQWHATDAGTAQRLQ
jgi:hypothetical protein